MLDRQLEPVVTAISDREQIDWDSVRRHLTHPEAWDQCAQLETVWKIARHVEPSGIILPTPREPLWVQAVIAIALLQVVFGLIGSIGYRDYSFANLLRVLTVLSFASVGLVLRWTRDNPRARDLGAVFVFIAFGFGRNPYVAWFDAWLGDYPALHVLRTGLAVDAWSPYFAWQFARRFPETNRFTTLDRTAIALASVCGVVGAVLFATNLWVSIAQPAAGILRTFALGHEESQRYSFVRFALTFPALAVIFLRARSAAADEQRRVHIFSLTMVAGHAPEYLEVLLETFVPGYAAAVRHSPGAVMAVVTASILPLLTIPFVTAYAVLVHRLLDVPVVIRAGMRYLLAKWTLVALTVTPSGLLVWHVYSRRHDSVAEVFTNPRGMLLAALVALGALLVARKDSLLRVLDRWFDRHAADRTAILAQAGDVLRLVRARSELVGCIADAADRALNAAATVWFFDPRRGQYLGGARESLPLSGDSALATILMSDYSLQALNTSSGRSVARVLPHAEREWLQAADACVVAPIRAAGGERPAGLMVFGPRRDAVGYSDADERFVSALAAGAGIALENLRLKAEAVGDDDLDDFGLLCARCRRVTDVTDGDRKCPCGGRLEEASVPRRINGKFLVEGLLGMGGMGVAYLASDIALHRYVALKTLPSLSPVAMTGLAREARTMAALSHPSLATILGHESWRGTPILVCEYLPGGTLQQRLARAPLSIEDALVLGLTLLDALEYMHGQGVLHRDIKPSNIAFARDRTPKLLYFGLAGLIERVQAPGPEAASYAGKLLSTRVAGTVAYLPPQAFEGGAPTFHFDLWALAVVLFEAIVGRHPFASGANTPENIRRGHLVVAPDAGAEASPAVAAFFRSALQPTPHSSLQSTTAMRDALTATRAAFHAERRHYAN